MSREVGTDGYRVRGEPKAWEIGSGIEWKKVEVRVIEGENTTTPRTLNTNTTP